MIHSMAGGRLGNVDFSDYAKIELLQGSLAGKMFWYRSPFVELELNDEVIVPFGNDGLKVLGKVVRIDRAVSSQNSPVPASKAKSIIRILDRKL